MEVQRKKIAGMGRRCVSALIDLFLSFIMIWFCGKLFGTATSDGDGSYKVTGFPILFGAFVTYSIYAMMEFKFKATPGKFIMGLSTGTETGEAITLKQSIQRNMLRFIDYLMFVGLVVALSSEKRQRIGDRIAKTIVYQD